MYVSSHDPRPGELVSYECHFGVNEKSVMGAVKQRVRSEVLVTSWTRDGTRTRASGSDVRRQPCCYGVLSVAPSLHGDVPRCPYDAYEPWISWTEKQDILPQPLIEHDVIRELSIAAQFPH